MLKNLVMLLGVSLLSTTAMAANQLMEYSIQDGLNTAEAKQKLGNQIHFYFAEKPANLNGQVIARTQVRRKTSRGFDEPCHRALLSSLLQLKKEAELRHSHYVVNIGSRFNGKKLTFNKDKYQCAVGLWAVEVDLQGDIMEATTSASAANVSNMQDAYTTETPITDMQVAPVIEEPAVLQIEPMVIRQSVVPRTISEPSTPVVKAKPAPVITPEMQLRLSALKSLYEAGEMDKQSYEQQKQQLLGAQ